MKRRYSLNEKEIDDLFKNGTLISNPIFFLYFKKSLSDSSKIAVAVSKKIKPIVLKNKVRRQIKNLSYQNFFLWEKHNLLIVVKYKYLENSFQKNSIFFIKGLKKIISRKQEL